MDDRVTNDIIEIKLLQKKAKIWIYEWTIVYIFFISTIIFLGINCNINFTPSLLAIIIVITLLTFKLINIERFRIKNYNSILSILYTIKRT